MSFVSYNLFCGASVARTDRAADVGGLVRGLIWGALIAELAPQREAVGRRLAIVLFGLLLVYSGAVYLQRSVRSRSNRQLSIYFVSKLQTGA